MPTKNSIARADWMRRHPEKRREYYLREKPGRKSLAELKSEATARTEKACSKCEVVKPMEEFCNRSGGRSRDGRSSECKACKRIQINLWKRAKKEAATKDRVSRELKDAVPGHKRCLRCGLQKPLEVYSVNQRNRDGMAHWCRECAAPGTKKANQKWVQGHREHMRRLKREAYHRSHPEGRSIAQVGEAKAAKATRLAKPCKECGVVKPLSDFTPNKTTADGRQYVCKPCLSVKERARYAKNPQMLESRKRWQKLHPECGRQLAHRRIARIRQIPGSHTSAQWLELCATFANRCVCCGKAGKLTRDHIIPVTDKRSSNDIENLQPLCFSCNAAKGNRRTTDYRGSPFTRKGEPRRLDPSV